MHQREDSDRTLREGIMVTFDMMALYTGIIAFICATLTAYTVTPPVRLLAYRIGAIDVPTDSRRMHRKPTPRIGGLAIFVAFVLTTMIFCEHSSTLYAIWIGGGVLVWLGIFDDIFRLPPVFKLLIQLGAAAIAVIGFGVKIEFITILGQTVQFGIFSIPVTMIWIVCLTNAINLIDGLDGLACGVSTITSLSMFGAMLIHGDMASAMITAMLVASCVGFLPYNKNPAKIFMGDTGALFLGYALSIISVQGLFKMNAMLSFLVPLSIFALPILDTVVAALRRMATGHNPFSADRGHFHHRLVDMGFSHKEAVSLLYAISGLLGLVAVMYTMGTTSGSGRKNALVIAVAALVILLLIFNCMRKPSTRILSGLAEHVSEIEIEARAEERAIMEKEQAEAERLKKEQKLEQKKHKNQH